MKKGKNEVIVQKWELCRAGFRPKPHGFTLHKDEATWEKYLEEYWKKMPRSTPEEYISPYHECYRAEVDSATFLKVSESTNGIFRFGLPPNPVAVAQSAH